MTLLEKFIKTDDSQANRDKQIALAKSDKYEDNTFFRLAFDYRKQYSFRKNDVEISMWDAAGTRIPVSWFTFAYSQGDIYVQEWRIKAGRKIIKEGLSSPVKVNITFFKTCTFTYYITPDRQRWKTLKNFLLHYSFLHY
jgi:hypothetical protein